MRNKVILLFTFMAGCCCFFIILYRNAVQAHQKTTDFERNYLHEELVLYSALDLGTDGYYFAGIALDSVYLFKPGMLDVVVVDPINKRTDRPIRVAAHPKQSRLQIVGSRFYLYDLEGLTIYSGSIRDFIGGIVGWSPRITAESVPIGKSTFVVRTLKEEQNEFTLAKMTMKPPRLMRQSMLLQKQVDGLFCTDGELHFVKDLNKLLYVYFYRNEYFTFDTLMHLSYRSHTIDTTTHVQIKTAIDKTNKKQILVSPGAVVNRQSCVSGKFLFIHSTVKGKNEDELRFYRSSTIDVYDVNRAGYVYSISLPRYHGIPVNYFKVDEKKLFATYGKFLVTYELPSPTIFLDQKSR